MQAFIEIEKKIFSNDSTDYFYCNPNMWNVNNMLIPSQYIPSPIYFVLK